MDLIDRQAAIDTILSLTNCSTVRELYEYIQEYQLTNYWTDGINDAIDAVIGVPSAQPEIIRCKDCEHFHYDMPYVIRGVPVLGHEVCDFWGGGCKTAEDGFCSYAERRTDG